MTRGRKDGKEAVEKESTKQNKGRITALSLGITNGCEINEGG